MFFRNNGNVIVKKKQQGVKQVNKYFRNQKIKASVTADNTMSISAGTAPEIIPQSCSFSIEVSNAWKKMIRNPKYPSRAKLYSGMIAIDCFEYGAVKINKNQIQGNIVSF